MCALYYHNTKEKEKKMFLNSLMATSRQIYLLPLPMIKFPNLRET